MLADRSRIFNNETLLDLLAPHVSNLSLKWETELVDASLLHLIAKFGQLKCLSLELWSMELQDREAALAGLSGLQNLEVLDLWTADLYGPTAHAQCISHLTRLSKLRLAHYTGGLCAAAGLCALQDLYLKNSCWRENEALPASLASMCSLTQLELRDIVLFPREDVTVLGTLPALASLSITCVAHSASLVASAAISRLTALTNLCVKDVNLEGSRNINRLAALAQLQELSLVECELTSCDFSPSLSRLQSLSLRYNRLTCLPGNLSALQALKDIDLAWQKADMQIDGQLAFLTCLTNLQRVHLCKFSQQAWSTRSVFYLTWAERSLKARQIEGANCPVMFSY